MDQNKKTPRKRDANFTADEKALLTMLIKKRPIIESKLSDGKSIEKKSVAWEQVTIEFNSHAHVNKRSTITLRRAWDNLKATTRKARAEERGSCFKTGGGPPNPPPPPQQGAITNMVEEAAPTIILEIENDFDSDGILLKKIDNPMEDMIPALQEDINYEVTSQTVNPIEDMMSDKQDLNYETVPIQKQAVGKTSDYVKKEAVLRIKCLEQYKSVKMQILKTKLETKETKKHVAALKEETAKILLKSQIRTRRNKEKYVNK